MTDTKATGFSVVKTQDIPAARTSLGRPMSPETIALLAGEAIFVPRVGNKVSSARRKTIANAGRVLRTRRGEHKGIQGTYLWTEEAK